MASERVYYHIIFSTTRSKPVFINEEVDAAFKQAAAEIARQTSWLLLELETMPDHVHLLLEKAPWDDLSRMIGYLKGRTARELLAQFPWLRGDLDSYRFWNRSYHYSRHTDESLDTVRAYIRNQRNTGGLAK